ARTTPSATRATRPMRCARGSRRASSPARTCTTTQEVARSWGAKVTPDVFVVDADMHLVYRGAPDADHKDESLDAAWVRAALDAVLAGEPVAEPETRPVGCGMKWRQ